MDQQDLQQTNKEPTNKEIFETTKEILEAVNVFSTANDKSLEEIKSRLGKVESNMVTKDHLDEKLGDLRGDLVILTRKEDKKVKRLVDILRKRNIISDNEVKEVLSMEPFAQLFVH